MYGRPDQAVEGGRLGELACLEIEGPYPGLALGQRLGSA